jgi:hypothetical protein
MKLPSSVTTVAKVEREAHRAFERVDGPPFSVQGGRQAANATRQISDYRINLSRPQRFPVEIDL